MSLVFNVLEQPGLVKLEGQLVEVELVASLTNEFAPGLVPSEDLAVFARAIIKTDEVGRWELDLRPTFAGDNVYSVTGLVYKVTESAAGGEFSYYIDVHAANIVDGDEVPQWVGDILTVAPDSLPTTGDFTAADIPLDTSGFDNNLNGTVGDVQEFADFFDDFDFGTPGGSGGHVIKQATETFTQRPTLRIAEGFLTVSDDNINEETILDIDLGPDLGPIDLLTTAPYGRSVLEQTDAPSAAVYLNVVSNDDIGITVPSLVGGVIPAEQLPALAINDVFTVASQVAMLALDAAVGDVAIRTDIESSFILADLPASLLGNWVELSFGGEVASVNGQTGIVTLTASDVGAVDTATFVAHVNDTTDAHDGSAISLDASGFVGNLDNTVDTVQELAAIVDGLEIGTGAPTGTAGGELTGTYPNPTVTTVHSGSSHADIQAAAEGTAAAALSAHIADTSNAHVAQAVSIDASGFSGGILAGTTTVQTFAATVNSLQASQLPVDTTDFIGNLTAAESTVQAAFNKLDSLVVDSPVLSVNGGVGAVVLDAGDVGAIDVALFGVPSGVATLDEDGRLTLAEWPDGLVTSVNGYNGSEVTLVAADIAIDASLFATNLDGTITDVQLLAEAVDDLVTGSVGIVPIASGGTGATTADDARDALAIIEIVEGNRLNATTGIDGTTVFDVNLAEGEPGGTTLIGGILPSDTLTLASTEDDERGDIVLRDQTHVIGEDKTHTDTVNGYRAFNVGDAHTITIDNANTTPFLGQYFDGIQINPNIEFGNDAFLFFASRFINVDATVGNVDTVPVTLANSNIFGHGAVYQASNANVDGLGVITFGDAPTFQKIGSCTLDVTAQTAFYTESTVGTGVTMTNRYGMRFVDATGSGTVHNQIAVDIAALAKGDTLNYGVRSPNANVLTTIYGSEASGGDLNLRATTHATTGTVFIHDEIEQRPTTQTFSGVPNWYGVRGTYSAGGTAIGRFIDINPTVLMTSNGSALINGTTFADRITYKNSGDFNFGTVTSFQAGPTITVDTQLLQTMDLLTGAFIAPTLNQSNSGTATLTDTTGVWWAPAVGTGWTVTTATALKVANPTVTGSGAITNLYGLDIATLTRGGTTNVGIRSPNTNILTTIYGSEASGGDLNLRATTHATTGTIFLHDDIELRPTDQSFTATPLWFEVNNTYTMDMDPGSAGTFVAIHPTVIFSKPGSGFGSSIGFSYSPTVKTAAAGTGDFSTTYGALFAPTYQADTLTGRTITLTTFAATPTISGTNSGTITLGSTTNFSSTATVTGSGVVIPTLTHFAITDAGGTGAVTNQYGLDIPALAKGGTTNIGIRSLGSNVFGAVYGSESSGGHLPLRASTHATDGDIQLDNKSVELLVTDYTNGGTNSNYTAIFADNTITMSSSGGSGLTGNAYKGISYTQLIDYTAAGHLTEGAMMFRDANTYRANGGTALDTGIVYSFQASPNLHGTSASGTPAHSMLSYQAYSSAPITARAAGSGTFTVTSMTQFNAGGPVIGGNTTIGTRTGLLVADATNSGTFTTQVGVDIAAMTAAGTNIGLRNKSQTQLGSSGQCTISTAGAIATSSSVLSSSATAGIGYATGAGGTASQTSSKSTAFPTISKACGTMTWNNATLNAHTGVTTASSTNTAIAATDTVIFNHISGGTIGAYTMTCTPGSGSWTLTLYNHSASNLGEAPVFAFSIIKAVTS